MSNKYIYKKLWGWLKQDQYYCTYKNPGLWLPCYSSFKYIYTGVNTTSLLVFKASQTSHNC